MKITKEKYPILEFDQETKAVINPNLLAETHPSLKGDCLIISFFHEVTRKLIREKKIVKHLVIKGENNLVLYKFLDADIYLMNGIVGGPASGGYLDELTGLGIKRVMFIGGGGVLDKNIKTGALMIVKGAIRDEGFSYHYLKPERIVYSDTRITEIIANYLKKRGIPFFEGITWTTDAFYRETRDLIQMRKEEGASMVEMEQASLLAVSKFRNLQYVAIIYSGDDISDILYDQRNWRDKKDIRRTLVEMAKELVVLF